MSDASGGPVADREPLTPGSPNNWLAVIRQILDGGLITVVRGLLRRRSSAAEDGDEPWSSADRRAAPEDPSIPGLAWLGIVLAIVALGAWGFQDLHEHPSLTVAESVYDSAKLYTVDLGPASGNPGPNWQIWVALIGATLLVARGIGALVRGHARRFATARLLREHVIVCGGGVHGSHLARELSDDHDVVLIDADPISPGMQGVRGHYEWRLIGDAVSSRMLLQAGVARAHRLIAVTGDDVVNSEIVSAVRRLGEAGRVRDRVDVQVQVEDPELSRFLEEDIDRGDVGRSPHAQPVVSPFSANAIAAGRLLEEARVGDSGGSESLRQRIESDQPVSLLLAGDHPLIDRLVLTVLARRRADHVERLEREPETVAEEVRVAPLAMTPVRISIYGPDAEARVLRLKERWRPEPQLVLLDGRDSAPAGESGAELDEWLRLPGRADHAIVACVDQMDGIVLTLGVARALGDGTPVTRVSTLARNALDDHVQRHTSESRALATTTVESIARLGSDTGRISELSGLQRLRQALRDRSPTEARDRAHEIVARNALRVRADLTWRIRVVDRPLLQTLLELDPPASTPAIPLSAMLHAGLRLELASPQNLLAAAQRLTAARHPFAFAAWCEYLHRSGDSAPERHAPSGSTTIDQLLRLAAAARGPASAAAGVDGPMTADGLAGAPHVTIFAGGAGRMTTATRQALATLLTGALTGYDGMLLSGGTDVGMPGVIAEAAAHNRIEKLVGYAPSEQPTSDRYRSIHRTDPGGFSIAEPLRMWEEILGAGRVPAAVTLIACPGGPITLAEIALARALGARIGWLNPLDETAATPGRDVAPPPPIVSLDDALVLGAAGIVPLPADPMTIRAFVIPSSLDPGLTEMIARTLHEQYRLHQLSRKPAGDLSLARWEELPQSLRDSNLALAADIPNKLALIGKRLTRPREGGGELVLTDEEVRRLAEAEHGRFNAERLEAGWRLGPRRVGRSTSPYLVPWADLPEDIRRYDVEAVQSLAAGLTQAGCGVADA